MNVDIESEEDLNKIIDPDNLTGQWLLTRSPYPVGFILCAYLLFVLKFGPQFMANREPYQCKNMLRVYNALQVCCNFWLICTAVVVHNLVPHIIRFTCSLEGHESIEDAKKALMIHGWYYFVLKILDLMDTVIMVLQKNNSHITFLHVYHHSTMVFIMWTGFNYFKSHHALVPGALNVIVHTVMYSYYLLSTFPRLKRHLWWKVYITKLQMSQFVLILAYFLYIYWKGCPMSKVFNYCVVFIIFTFLCLFVNFYIKTYTQAPSNSEDKCQLKTK